MPKSADTLSERERRFVDAYMGEAQGNATKAARLAGYSQKNARQQGARLLTKADIKAEVVQRQSAATSSAIATATELQEWWSKVCRGQESESRMLDRLKASELLGKAKGIFIDKQEHSGPDGGPVRVSFGGRYREAQA